MVQKVKKTKDKVKKTISEDVFIDEIKMLNETMASCENRIKILEETIRLQEKTMGIQEKIIAIYEKKISNTLVKEVKREFYG